MVRRGVSTLLKNMQTHQRSLIMARVLMARVLRAYQNVLLPGMLTLALLFWLQAVPFAYANGTAVTVVYQGQQGPYLITVRAITAQLVRGNAHLSILVQDAVTQRLVNDPKVNMQAEGPDGTISGPEEGFHSITTPDFYDFNMPVTVLGTWQFTVNVTGVKGNAQFVFPLEVQEPVINWSIVGGILVLVLLALPLVFVGLRALRGGKGKPKPQNS